MKKNFFGYNIKETDEAMRLLISQNDALIRQNNLLEEEIKNLKSNLKRISAILDSGMTKTDSDNYRTLKLSYNALLQKSRDLEKEISILKNIS